MIIDVEGAELYALQGFDWSNIKVYVLAIEISEPKLPKNQEIKKMLTEHGFVFKERMAFSEIWINENNKSN